MDVGFHYYVVYLLCAGLGMTPKITDKISYASQHVDDNIMWTTVDKNLSTEFPVVATFSIDLSKKSDDKNTTLLIHFPPGDGPDVTGMRRADNTWFEGITTPKASMAENALDKALSTGNPYLVGVALHTYADTWAHQGFAGCEHTCNVFPGSSGKYQFSPPLGHGQAGHFPDLPITWEDNRRIGEFCKINNKVRFREAATSIALKLDAYLRPNDSPEQRSERVTPIIDKIFKAFGEPIPVTERKENEIEILSNAQINSFRRLGLEAEFGGEFIEAYDPDRWTRNIIYTDIKGLNDNWLGSKTLGLLPGLYKDQYYWQPTYFERKAITDFQTHSSSPQFLTATSMKLESILTPESPTKYFSSFPASGIDKTWPDVVQDTARSPLFQFHVAAQTHLGHLIHETQKRSAPAKKKPRTPISLYTYYDEGKTEPWVQALQRRTRDNRKATYGDDD